MSGLDRLSLQKKVDDIGKSGVSEPQGNPA
jgi:hypothetical protein